MRVAFQIYFDGTEGEVIQRCGIYNTEADFIADANALLDAERVNRGITGIKAGSLVLRHSPREPWTLNVTTNDGLSDNVLPDFAVIIGSPIIGTCQTMRVHWTEQNTTHTRVGVDPSFGVLVRSRTTCARTKPIGASSRAKPTKAR